MKAKIIIPETLSEITLKQYIDFLDVDQTQNEIDVLRQIIFILCKGDLKHVDSLTIAQITIISDVLNKLISETKTPFQPIIEIEGAKFGFIPNLADDITIGEYGDLELYFNDKYYKNLHKIMAIFYRPILNQQGNLYNIEKYQGSDKYSEYFLNHFPVAACNGALLFFFNLGNELLKITNGYTNPPLKKTAQTSSPN